MKTFLAISALLLVAATARAKTGDYSCKTFGGFDVSTEDTDAQTQSFLNTTCDKTKPVELAESATGDLFHQTACCIQK